VPALNNAPGAMVNLMNLAMKTPSSLPATDWAEFPFDNIDIWMQECHRSNKHHYD
jgi:hypothetical protein